MSNLEKKTAREWSVAEYPHPAPRTPCDPQQQPVFDYPPLRPTAAPAVVTAPTEGAFGVHDRLTRGFGHVAYLFCII